jgi:hypothetical protein
MPDERYRAVIQTREFLFNLVNPVSTPGVPKAVRKEAASCLRHYPNEWEMQEVSEKCPAVFQEKMEPLYRLVKEYTGSKST